MLSVAGAGEGAKGGVQKVKPLEDRTFHLVRFSKRWGGPILLWPETRVPNSAMDQRIFWGILSGCWSLWGAIFGLSGSGPPAVPPLVFADLGQEGGTAEVIISPDCH